jgi:hypothetical protein
VYAAGGALAGGVFGPEARRLFHTRYHHVPKLEEQGGNAALAIKW